MTLPREESSLRPELPEPSDDRSPRPDDPDEPLIDDGKPVEREPMEPRLKDGMALPSPSEDSDDPEEPVRLERSWRFLMPPEDRPERPELEDPREDKSPRPDEPESEPKDERSPREEEPPRLGNADVRPEAPLNDGVPVDKEPIEPKEAKDPISWRFWPRGL